MNAATPPARPRHALVIAGPGREMPVLSGLDRAARNLHATLTAPAWGACESSLDPRFNELMLSGRATQAEVESGVREAARAAGAAGACLVLAFLGHGFVSAGNSTLYFMAANTGEDEISSGVDVGSLLVQAIEQHGVDGLIGLVDTCHAGAAAPNTKDLVAGIREGQSRLGLLMASGCQQAAYDLSFSTALTQLMRRGLPNGEAVLDLVALKKGLRRKVRDQDTRYMSLDGDNAAEEELWLGHNPRCGGSSPSHELGTVGRRELEGALVGWRLPARWPGATRHGLRELRDAAGAEAPDNPAAQYVWEVADGLLTVLETVELIDLWVGRQLTTRALRRAARVLRTPSGRPGQLPPSTGRALLRDLLEHAVLLAPSLEESPTVPLCRLLIAIGEETGADPDAKPVADWAAALEIAIDLNDAREQAREARRAKRLRLVVSLHSALTQWPETVDVWLLDDVASPPLHEEFRCRPDQGGAERAVADAVRWATPLARERGVRLRSVDVVLPTHLLATWQPERVKAGRYLLGARHDVVVRWSDRLQVPGHLAGINDEARQKLTDMQSGLPAAPVDWLGKDTTQQPTLLQEQLSCNAYSRAIGLDHRPATLVELLELLLSYSPIVLWPVSESFPEQHRDRLGAHWENLPAGLLAAYRRRWGAQLGLGAETDPDPLADLRTVWHDLPFLDFCEWFDQQSLSTHWSY